MMMAASYAPSSSLITRALDPLAERKQHDDNEGATRDANAGESYTRALRAKLVPEIG